MEWIDRSFGCFSTGSRPFLLSFSHVYVQIDELLLWCSKDNAAETTTNAA